MLPGKLYEVAVLAPGKEGEDQKALVMENCSQLPEVHAHLVILLA